MHIIMRLTHVFIQNLQCFKHVSIFFPLYPIKTTPKHDLINGKIHGEFTSSPLNLSLPLRSPLHAWKMPGSPRPYPRRWPFVPRCCRMKGTPQRELRRGRISSSWENNGDGNLGIVGMEVDFSVHPFIDGCSFFLNQPFLDTPLISEHEFLRE